LAKDIITDEYALARPAKPTADDALARLD